MLYPKPADIAQLKADANIQVLENRALTLSYLSINTQKKPLADKRVRQALAMSIDKAAIVKAVYEGAATPAHLPLPALIWGYDKTIKPYAMDAEKAKKLLKEASFDNSTELNIYVRNGGGGTNPNPKLTAEMIQADWSKIGVKAKIVVMEWVELQKRTKAGEHDVTIYGWAGDNGDPDNFLTPNLSCSSAESGENRSRWCNKAFSDLLDKAKLVTDKKERTKLYEQAQKIFMEEMPQATLVEPLTTVAFQKSVIGYKASPFTKNNFEKVYVK